MRSWLEKICLDCHSIALVSSEELNRSLQNILDTYKEVFASELGTIHPFKFKVKLTVAPEARSKFHRARPVPFALRSAVEEALDCLEVDGILEKISHSDWAAPIVTIPKKDSSIRICGDYKVTINPVLEVDQYPLP